MADNELPLTGSPQPPTGGPTPSTSVAALQARADTYVAQAVPSTTPVDSAVVLPVAPPSAFDYQLAGSPLPPPTAPPSVTTPPATPEAPATPPAPAATTAPVAPAAAAAAAAAAPVEAAQAVAERSVDPTAPLAPAPAAATATPTAQAVNRQLPGLTARNSRILSLVGQNHEEQAAEAHAEAATIAAESAPVEQTNVHEEGYGSPPHGFAERAYQVFHHDIRVYIQGVDVSNWLEGSVVITNNVGTEPNSCDITLNNALDRFVLTPDNFAGIWRLSPPGEVADYDETAKHSIYEIKNPIGNNPIDDRSGGRMWPLEYYCSIFHAMDPIRVWIRNPMNIELNEWIPMFCGYVVNVGDANDYVRHGSTITLGCKDIRHLMAKMRTNRNSVLWVQPGNELTENNTRASTIRGNEVPTAVGGGAFSPNFFEDLVVINRTMSDPWSTMNLWQIIKYLTYSTTSAEGILNVTNEAELHIVEEDLNRAREQLAALPANAQNTTRREALTRLIATLESRATNGNNTTGAPPLTQSQPTPVNTANVASVSADQNQSIAPNPQAAVRVGPNGMVANPSHGRSRIGRITKGKTYAYPSPLALADIEVETEGATNDEVSSQNVCLANFTNIVMFGFPDRESGPDGLVENPVIDQSTIPKYWTEAQVQEAGKWTRSNRSWAPDVQMVHVLKPKVSSAGAAVIRENHYIDGGAVNTQYQWMSRLDLLAEACEMTDYRFYVSGSGDLIFEFPMYDFYPADFSTLNRGWQQVYEFNSDLVSDSYNPESGEIVNCVIAVGGMTGYSQFAEAGSGDQSSTALSPEDQPHAIVYCPTLTGRHGVNVKTLALPRIQSVERLQQIATINMQKWFGQANNYSMEAAYRPWFGLNRVAFNAFRNRYALAESITHTIPVRESSGNPSTSFTLSYPRNLDQFGVPRFFTGGSSMPVYFGSIPARGSITSLVTALQLHSSSFRELLQRVQSEQAAGGISDITHNDLILYQTTNRAPFPQSADFYNVVQAISIEYQNLTLDDAGGSAAAFVRRAEDIQNRILNLQTNTGLSQNERAFQMEQLERQLEQVTTQINAIQVTTNTDATGGVPLYGRSGIRRPEDDSQPDNGAGDTSIALCDLDRYRWSSPLGKNGTEFPRQIVSEYSDSHPGVDYLAVPGESVYAVADGHVSAVRNNRTYGKVVVINHGTVYSAYAPVNASVSVGNPVRRNQVIGTVGTSTEATDFGSVLLHFVLMSDAPEVPTEVHTSARNFFVPPTHFPLARAGARFIGTTVRQSFRQSRPEEGRVARVHGGYDLGCVAGHPIEAPVDGVIKYVYVNHPQIGYGIGIEDAQGALHGLFHFQEPVNIPSIQGKILANASGTCTLSEVVRITAGTTVGFAGETGSATGVHLHYQVELSRSATTAIRVDIGPRLAALWGEPTQHWVINPAPCRYEAENVYERNSGRVQNRRQLPDDALDSPVEGKTVAQIWAALHASDTNYQPPEPLATDMTYFNTAVGPDDPYGVPFRPNQSGLANSNELSFAMVGDVYATRDSLLRKKLETAIAQGLNRTNLSLDPHGNIHSSIALWGADPNDAATRRRVSDRGMNSSQLIEYASQYKIILVSLTGIEYNAADMTVARVHQIDELLSSSGAYVFWLTHKALSTRVRAVRGSTTAPNRTIQQLVAAGVPLAEADIHLASRARILAAIPPDRVIDGSTLQPTDIVRINRRPGWDSHGNYTSVGANNTAPQMASDLVSKLHAIAARVNTTAIPVEANAWVDAQPPEDCPPERQRLLASTTTAPPIPGSPQMLIVTPGEQAEVTPNPAAVPATAAQRREARNRNRRLQQARQHQGTPTQIPTTVTTPATPATGNR